MYYCLEDFGSELKQLMPDASKYINGLLSVLKMKGKSYCMNKQRKKMKIIYHNGCMCKYTKGKRYVYYITRTSYILLSCNTHIHTYAHTNKQTRRRKMRETLRYKN